MKEARDNKMNEAVVDQIQVITEIENGAKRYELRKKVIGSSAYHLITLNEDEAKQLYLLLGKELGYLFTDDSIKSVEEDRKSRRADFSLSEEQIKSIEFTEDPLTLKDFVKMINKHVDKVSMKLLSITPINKWLVKNGYLSEEKRPSTIYKTVRVITDKASEIGITEEVIVDKAGKVLTSQVAYPPEAQRFILEHLNEITGKQ